MGLEAVPRPPFQPGQAAMHDNARRRMTLTTLIVASLIAAILHIGAEIFLPLAFAVVITFALSPVVTFLRNRGLPNLVAVLGAVTVTFVAIGLFMLVVAAQVGTLARDLPTFQANIVTKLDSVQDSGDGTGAIARLTRMITEIGDRINAGLPEDPDAETPQPVQVKMMSDRNAFEVLRDLVLPLIGPVATAGLVIVVVIFMLLERDELRDRLIRLVGTNDIHKSTQVMEDAGSRVARYLLMQLLVNVIYAVPIGLGLWVIGVPNAVLWGMLTLVLRFVPYVGSIMAAVFPLFLAIAASPDWSMLLWTGALFLVIELITSNIIEPWLYGSGTGVSPLAIIVSAIFWTWIWGPMGLVLSTPLTVCLVVLGRHIPQFEVFNILFGDEPVLAPHSRLYQRLLVGDVVESTFRAEEALEEQYLSDYHRDVGIPALLLAQSDYERGIVDKDQELRMAAAAMRFLDELDAVVVEELEEASAMEQAADRADRPTTNGGSQGRGHTLVSIGGQSELDDVAARMLAQAARAEGAEVTSLVHVDLAPSRFSAVTSVGAGCVVLNFLDSKPPRVALLHIRRIKRAAPKMRVGVVIWQASPDMDDADMGAEARGIGADFCVGRMEDALREAFSDADPVPLPEPLRSPVRKRARIRAAL